VFAGCVIARDRAPSPRREALGRLRRSAARTPPRLSHVKIAGTLLRSDYRPSSPRQQFLPSQTRCPADDLDVQFEALEINLAKTTTSTHSHRHRPCLFRTNAGNCRPDHTRCAVCCRTSRASTVRGISTALGSCCDPPPPLYHQKPLVRRCHSSCHSTTARRRQKVTGPTSPRMVHRATRLAHYRQAEAPGGDRGISNDLRRQEGAPPATRDHASGPNSGAAAPIPPASLLRHPYRWLLPARLSYRSAATLSRSCRTTIGTFALDATAMQPVTSTDATRGGRTFSLGT